MTTLVERRQQQLEPLLQLAPVVAIVSLQDAEDAVPLARALVAGGIRTIELTLRTRAALDAIRAIADNVEGAIVGAGTVLNPQDLRAVEQAGARFAISPGLSPGMLTAADNSSLPYLPGAATASEAMTLLERGYRLQKFFPAAPAGGADLLRALAGPLPAIRFCPTGGIDAANAESYLRLPNVICVGGSWLTPQDVVKARDWAAITSLAKQAAALRRM